MKAFDILYNYIERYHEPSDIQRAVLLKMLDAFNYADDIVNGDIISCVYVKQACQRFFNDFERSDYEKEILFDCDAAYNILHFYILGVKHVKGKLTGKPIDLMPWHAFILINLFGWYRAQWQEDPETGERVCDDKGRQLRKLNDNGKPSWCRRFNTAYNEVARKNAKSTLASGIGNYMTGFDGEGGAEVYSAATTRDQARIVWDDSKKMILASPLLKDHFNLYQYSISHPATSSKFVPLSSDANSLDGLNIHCAIVDELHAHKKRDVWDVLETATGARENPLILAITTAGTNLQGICREVRDYSIKILNGSQIDDTFFAIIYTLDEGDDPFDESVWFKANPALGVAKKWDDLRRLAVKAKEQPTALANFLTKHMNQWVHGANGWLNMMKWQECLPVRQQSKGKCYIGVDLAQKIDLSAAIKINVFDDGTIDIRLKAWIPEERLLQCTGQQRDLYRRFETLGELVITDGASIDQELIEIEVEEWMRGENMQEIAVDPWNTTQFALNMIKKGFTIVEVPQRVSYLSQPMKIIESMVVDKTLHHEHSELMTWMMSNVCAIPDKNENLFPFKERPENKIDGASALFTAMNRVIVNEDHHPKLGFLEDDEDVLFF